MKLKITKIISSLAMLMCIAALIYMPQRMETWIDTDIPFYNPSTGDVITVEVAASEADYEAEHARIAAAMAAKGYTQELGYDYDKERQATAKAIETGESEQEALIDIYKNQGDIPDNAHMSNEAKATEDQAKDNIPNSEHKDGNVNNNNNAEGNTVETEENTTEDDNSAADKLIEHGVYDSINNEALEAFEYFLSDGVNNSCYIQVKNSSENKEFPAACISRTSSAHENGEVQFVDDNKNVVYSYVFPQVEANDDLDLSVSIEDIDNVVKVSPVVQPLSYTDLGYSLSLKIYGITNSHNNYYVYTKSNKAGENYIKYMASIADKDGTAEIKLTTLQDYYISTTPLIQENNSAESVEESSENNEEQEIIEEKETEKEIVRSDTNDKTVVDNNPVEESVSTNTSNYVMWLVIGMAVVICTIIGVIIWKKK